MLKRYYSNFVSFLADESGPTAVEYAVMMALIIGLCIAAIGTLGTTTADSWQNVADQMNSFAGPGGN